MGVDDYESTGQYWPITAVTVGHGFGMEDDDDRFSDTVFMSLTLKGLDKPGNFVASVDNMELLALAILDSVRQSREENA